MNIKLPYYTLKQNYYINPSVKTITTEHTINTTFVFEEGGVYTEPNISALGRDQLLKFILKEEKDKIEFVENFIEIEDGIFLLAVKYEPDEDNFRTLRPLEMCDSLEILINRIKDAPNKDGLYAFRLVNNKFKREYYLDMNNDIFSNYIDKL